MADCEEIEAVHAQKKGKGKERNWKDEEIEMLITLYEERPCLWDVGHKDYMNRDIKEVAYSQIDLLMFDKYDISREDYKSKWKIIRSQFMREQVLERKKKSGQPMSVVYHSSWKWYKMLKFLVIVHNSTKGFDTMKAIKVTEDDENESPATMTPMKKTKEDFNRKRMTLLDRAAGEVNEAPATAAELSEEEAFGVVVARTLARLSTRKRMLTKKKINDILFEAEFHDSEQTTTGHVELSSYNPIYGAPLARAAEYFPTQFSTL